MKYGYLLIGLALAICVGLFYIEADDSDASVSGGGTQANPYTYVDIDAGSMGHYFYPDGTKYVKNGSYIRISYYSGPETDEFPEYVTPGKGLNISNDTLTGYVSGSNGDVVTVRLYVTDGESSGTSTYSFIISNPVYTVTWKNWDGTTLETDYNVPSGTTPTYNSGTPTRPATAQYTYTFTGWSPSVGPISGNTTYTAQFSQTLRSYTVTWANWDGTVLETDTNVNYGTTPTYNGATPTRPSDQYIYTFTGWSPNVSAVTGNITYTAQYSTAPNVFTVTWNNWDGTVLETDLNVPYGTTPTYDGTTPSRPTDSQYMYEFAGWSPAVGPISGDTTYTAQIPAIWQYTLSSGDATIVAYLGSGGTGVDIEIPSSITYNGTTYPVRTVGNGSDSVIPTTVAGRNLVIPDTVTVIKTYSFELCSGFTGALSLSDNLTTIGLGAFYNCSGFTGNLVIPDSVITIGSHAFESCTGFTGDLVIPDSVTTIEYEAFYNCTGLNGNLIISWDTALGTNVFINCTSLHFPYQFKNYDDTVLQSGYVLYNTTPSYTGSTPVKPSTSTESYHFNGWSPTPDTVMTPMRYTAQYTTVNIFTVVWKNWNGTVLETDIGVEERTTPTYDGTTPTKPDQYQFTYSFSTWSPAVGPITGYTEYTAVYTETALWSYSLNIHTPTATIDGYLGSGGTDVDIIIPSVVLENNVEYTVRYIGTGSNVIPTSITGRNLVIPDTVTDIENRAFDGCRGLTGTLTIGDSVTKIGGIVFNNCSGFTGNLVIPDSVETIGVQAFRNCSGFTGTLTLGDSLQSIGGGAFAGCRGFTGNLVIPDSVTSISLQAFQLCRGFNGLTIGNSVTSIGNSAFDACSGFTGDLVIPNSVTTIGSSAFNNCTGLNGNLIISWDTSFSDDSFTGCTSLHFPTQFKNYDGTVLQEGYVLYGQIPAYSGSTPTKPMDEDYEYAFAGWSPTPVAIQIPSRYTAEFTPLFRYTVTWTNWDDSVLLVDKWADGTTPVYSGATPTRPATVQYTYEFSSWTPTPVAIHENTTFKADFTGTLIVYDFGDWQYVLDDNYDAVISHNTEREGVLQIPVVADGYAVKSFNGGNMVQATGIIIPRSITAVANDAFSGSGITEVLNLSDVPITGTSHGLNNATVYTSVPGWMYINDTTYIERVPDDSPTSGLIRVIPLLIIIGIIVHILRNRVGNGDE